MRTFFWKNSTDEQRQAALKRPAQANKGDLTAKVAEILAEVKANGDTALRSFTAKFDNVELTALEVSSAEFAAAKKSVGVGAREALERAAANIEKFHVAQIPVNQSVETESGVVCERQFRPVSRVGLYVPGGSACLPSTVLMLGVPSRLAGCELRVLCTPPRKDGSVDPFILEAARLCRIDKVFKVGGAQAIAALAYGTESVPKVDKIFGPGNSWVTEAKEQVASAGAAIDMPAGPSEVLVIADANANPVFVAADLLSQAEHGPDSQVVLVTDSEEMVTKVQAEVAAQLKQLPRETIAAAALEKSLSIVVNTIAEAIAVSNQYAPEHLIVQVDQAARYKDRILNAGSVFLGPWSPESAGDYASGTNHVLPTYGFARAYSGLSVDSFLKQITFQELTEKGIQGLGETIEILATIERLDAHRNAVSVRLAALNQAKEKA